jgi:hypothetical protein
VRRPPNAPRSHWTVRLLHDADSPTAVSCLQRFQSGSTLHVRISPLAGGTDVLTIVTFRRRTILADPQAIAILGRALREGCRYLCGSTTVSVNSSLRTSNLGVCLNLPASSSSAATFSAPSPAHTLMSSFFVE